MSESKDQKYGSLYEGRCFSSQRGRRRRNKICTQQKEEKVKATKQPVLSPPHSSSSSPLVYQKAKKIPWMEFVEWIDYKSWKTVPIYMNFHTLPTFTHENKKRTRKKSAAQIISILVLRTVSSSRYFLGINILNSLWSVHENYLDRNLVLKTKAETI